MNEIMTVPTEPNSCRMNSDHTAARAVDEDVLSSDRMVTTPSTMNTMARISSIQVVRWCSIRPMCSGSRSRRDDRAPDFSLAAAAPPAADFSSVSLTVLLVVFLREVLLVVFTLTLEEDLDSGIFSL